VTADSIAQYEQALAGVYTDHHPPLMAWLWSRLDRIVRGPFGMLALHAALFWTAFLLFADGARQRGLRHAWLLLLIGLFPPILGIEGEIWKDVGMAAALLFAAAVLYRASAAGQRVGAVAATVSLVAIFYATSVRANAPAAAAPVIVYWVLCTFPRLPARAVLRAGIAILVLVIAAGWVIDARVLQAKRMHASQVLEAFDLAAIRCAGGDATIPQAFVRADTGGRLCAALDSRDVDLLYFAPDSPLQLSTDRSSLRELGREWRRAIVAWPGKYLAHRFRAFTSLLGFDVPDVPRLLWQPSSVANAYGFTFTPNAVTGVIGAGVAISHALGLYNGLGWLLLAAAIAVLAWRDRRRDVAAEAVLAISAITYTLAYFFVALAPDYRYIYWSIVATAVAAVLAVLRSRGFSAFERRVADAIRLHVPPWPLALLAGAGCAVTLVAYYPGLLTFDSIWQFNQSMSGKYMDHHPPIMAWLWALINRAIPGPSGMLLLQVSLTWLALLLFADGAARRGVRHAWLIVAIGFLPPILGIEGEIWKDVQMVAALLFATALIYRASAGRERIGGIVATLALIPLFYATAVRANAPAAAGPILIYWARCTFRHVSLRASVLAGAAALAMMLGAQWAFENAFLQVRHAYVSQFLQAYDIVAIGCAGGAVSIPDGARSAAPDPLPLCDAFDPLQVDFLYAQARAPLRATTEPGVVRALGDEWRRAIVAYPSLYLAHRWRAFSALLGIDVDDARRPLWIPASIPNVFGFTFAPNAITHAIGAGVGVANAARLYDGRVWLALALAVLVACGVRARRGVAFDAAALALAVSAIAYTLPYFVVAVAPDYRYLYWTVVATAVGGLLALLPRRRALSR
jgi:hypothetical protein